MPTECTVVIRPVADPDLPVPLRLNVVIEAKRLLLIQSRLIDIRSKQNSNVIDITGSRHTDYRYIVFECVSMDTLKRSAVVIVRDEKIRIRCGINAEFPKSDLKIGDDHYTIEFAEIPLKKETHHD
jgi:hypothetical protein